MAITKRAILISNPGEVGAENYCKGVYVDIRNFQRHLTSDEGGAWESSEIKHLDRPTAHDVRWWLELFSFADYTLVLFTGHGFYSSRDRDRILELKAGETIASVELRKGAKKRSLILDCCQKVEPEPELEKRARRLIKAEAREVRRTNRLACARLFSESVEKSAEGIICLTSCAIGELSTDDDSRGGRYSGSLFECVDDWVSAKKGSVLAGDGTCSIVAAHECAAVKTQKLSANKQNPSIEKPRASPYFPIAVFA